MDVNLLYHKDVRSAIFVVCMMRRHVYMRDSFLAQCGRGKGGSSAQATHTLILDTALLLEIIAAAKL